MGKVRLYASIKVKEEGNHNTIFSIKNTIIDKAFRETIEFVNKKYSSNFIGNLREIMTRIKRNIKNERR